MSLSDLGNAQQLGGSQFSYVLSQLSGKSIAEQNDAIPSTGESIDFSTASKVLVPNPTEGQSAVSLAYANANYGGGSSNQSLNEINFAHPLTNNLSFVGSQYTLLTNQPLQANAVANKIFTDTLVQNEANTRSNADQTLQTNINNEESARIAGDNGLQDNIDQLSDQVWKRYPLFSDKTIATYNAQTIDSLISGGTGQSLNQINDQFPLTAPLNLTVQPVFVGTPLINAQPTTKAYTDQLVLSEAVQRGNADNNLQNQIDSLEQRSLNEINQANALTNNLDFSGSSFKVRVANPSLPLDVANKYYVDNTIGQISTNAIKAIGDPTTQRQIYQGGEFLQIQGVDKQEIDVQKFTSYVPMRYSEAFPITNQNQLGTVEQIAVVQANVVSEAQDRASADQGILDTALNEWPAGIQADLSLQNNSIINLYTPLIGAGDGTATNAIYVRGAINTQALQTTIQINAMGAIAQGYTDNKIADINISSIGAPQFDVSWAYNKLVRLADPEDDYDAANKQWTLAQISSGTSANLVQINNAFPSTGLDLNLNTCSSVKVPEPSISTEAATLFTVESKIANTKLSDLQPPTSALNFNAQKLQNIANGQANEDAITVGQVVDTLIDYITIQNANDAFRSRISTLSDIQLEEPATLNMGAYKITGLAQATEASDAVRFDQLPVVNPGNEITQGNSFVKVNANETISLTANNQEVLFIEPTQAVVTRALVSTSAPPSDVTNAILTKSQLDPYYIASGSSVSRIQNSTETASVIANENSNVNIKAGGVNSSNLTVSCINNNNYTVSASDLTLSSAGYLTLNGAQRVQCTTPLLSNSLLDTGSTYQVFNKSQNDGRYYQNTVPLNQITAPNSDVAMAGNTLSNIRDAVDNLEPTNLAQVTSLIANSGFKNKIQSQSQHAQVICNQPSDTVSIKANNSPATINISATGSDYTLANTGKIIISAEELNVNGDSFRVVGNGGGSTIFLAGDLQSTSLDLDIPTQILTRAQNDQRYLVNGTTLSQLFPPDTSVSFGNQLLRNLQSPITGSDASTKAYIDNLLPNYVTNEALVAGWLTKSQASTTYRTEQQVDSQISTALIPYSTTSEIASTYLTQANAAITYITPSATDTKISTALVPYLTQASASTTYLTQANAASTYQRQDTPFTSISSADQLNRIVANQGLNGIDFFASNAGVTNKVCTISQPASFPQSVQIVSPSRIFLTSGIGSMSFYSGSGQTSNAIYIGSSSDNASAFCSDSITIGNGSNRMGLVLSTGHSASNQPFSIISANANSAANSLILSPEISSTSVSGGNSLYQYSNALSSVYPIQNQFTKPCGLSYAQSTVQGNEFLTLTKANSLYSGGISSQITSTGNSTVACSSNGVDITINALAANVPIRINKATDTSQWQIQPIISSYGLLFGSNFASVQVLPLLQASGGLSTQALTIGGTTTFNGTVNGNINMNNTGLITNLSSGTIASGNNSSVTGGNVYDYLAGLPQVVTQQVYTVTVQGSTTNGFQWTAFTNTPQTGTVQCQRVKGSGAQMITSSVITSQSQTLVPDFATLQLQVANANVRVTQVVPYTTTVFATPGQQNIASMTFSQQAISSTATCIQLYKPQGAQGSAAFILYVYVDQF